MQQNQDNGEPQLNGNVATNGIEEKKDIPLKLHSIDVEMIKIIGQYLDNLGFKDTVKHLMVESGCRLDHPKAITFRSAVISGDWESASESLNEMAPLLIEKEKVTEMRFLLLEQKFLELLEKGDDLAALACLRGEISPLEHNVTRVHRLSSLIFYSNSHELKRASDWQGSGPESRMALFKKLMTFLPASVMLPPHRLERILVQAMQQQVRDCHYHNLLSSPMVEGAVKVSASNDLKTLPLHKLVTDKASLLVNHQCDKKYFPTTCTQTVVDHTDEVLCTAFSPNGLLLATGSKDNHAIIWDVDQVNHQLNRRHSLDAQGFHVVQCVWSPDNTKLITCLQDDASELIVWDADRGTQICKVSDSTTDALTNACWYKDSERFVCGGIRGQFFQCNLEGNVIERWDGVRVQGLAMDSDDKTVLASDTHKRIRGYQLEDINDFSVLQEDHGIMSFTLDKTGRYALLNVSTQGVHLWDLRTRTLVRRYRGGVQAHCTIQSTFGGINEDFIASGSEDSHVYIWNRAREEAILVLKGHRKTVNAVSWNPVNHTMLVSVSDDNTIKVWGPESKRPPSGEDEDQRSICTPQNNGQLPHFLSNLALNDES